MSNGTIPLRDLVQQIEARDEDKVDVIADPRNLFVDIEETGYGFEDDEPTFRPVLEIKDTDKGAMTISDVAHDQFAGWSPIGTRYYHHMLGESPALWQENVNHWLSEGEKPRMLRLLDDGHEEPHTRAFLSNQYGRYEDKHLLRPVLERATENGWDIDHCALTDRRMHIRILFPKLEGEVRRGDVIQAGAAFTNSEVGYSAWKAEFFLLRLLCMNGMTGKELVTGFHRRHITSKQQIGWLSASTLALEDTFLQAAIGDTLESMQDEGKFQTMLQLMKDSAEAKLDDVVEATQVLGKRISLTQDETKLVQGNLVEEGDATLWGLVNALTRTAKALPSFERRAELEAQAGKIIEHPRQWSQITSAAA